MVTGKIKICSSSSSSSSAVDQMSSSRKIVWHVLLAQEQWNTTMTDLQLILIIIIIIIIIAAWKIITTRQHSESTNLHQCQVHLTHWTLNRKWSGSPDWSISGCTSDRFQNVVDWFRGRCQSFHQVWPLTVWQMLINLLTLIRNADGSGKVMRNPYPGSDHHKS